MKRSTDKTPGNKHGPATTGEANVRDYSHSNGRRTSYHPNAEQLDAIRDKMRRLAKQKR